MDKIAAHQSLHLAFFSMSCLCLVQLLNCAAYLFKSLSHSRLGSNIFFHFLQLHLTLPVSLSLNPYCHLSFSVCNCPTTLLAQGKVSACVSAFISPPSSFSSPVHLSEEESTSLKVGTHLNTMQYTQ